MPGQQIEKALSNAIFGVVKSSRNAYNRLDLPVLSTGRSFALYRQLFFGNRPAHDVLESLRGKRIVDIGCGLTPHVSNSMFQECRQAGVDFWGVDPKLADGFRLGLLDRAKTVLVGGGRMMRDAPGMEKAVAALADDLPFDDGSVDLILSSHVLYAWIDDERVLAGIFREFHRVLRPGGKAMIYPTPFHEPARIRHPELREVLRSFRVEQKFLARMRPSLGAFPAHLRTMQRLPD